MIEKYAKRRLIFSIRRILPLLFVNRKMFLHIFLQNYEEIFKILRFPEKHINI